MAAVSSRPRNRRGPEVVSLADTFDGLRADYSAAKSSKYKRQRTGFLSLGSGADYHIRVESEYLRMGELARDMDRNDTVVGQTIDRAVTNTLQEGMRLDPKTGDRGADKELRARWKNWSEDADQCDSRGEFVFADQERFALRQTLVDGDIVALPLRRGCLELVESHRLRTPKGTTRNVVHGILMDSDRKPQEYWLTKQEIDPYSQVDLVRDVRQYPARDRDGNKQVYHVYNPKRVSASRGVTALAPIFDVLSMLEDINFAKLVQQQVVSCFAIFRERSIDNDSEEDVATGELSTEQLADGTSRTLEGIAPGMELTGRPGEKLQGFSPNVPNAEFFQHVRLILTLVGVNLGLPLCIVMLDGSETNFSGWRGALDQAKMGFRHNQRWLIDRFHRPVYRWKVRQWLAEDPALRVAANRPGVDIFGHKWNRPEWPYIQPLDDASTDLLRQRNVLSSPRRIQAERGRDWEEIALETIEDNAFAIVAAKKKAAQINKRFPEDPVHWRELVSLPTPDGVTVKVAAMGGAGVGQGAQPAPNQKPGGDARGG